jgi:hypothetical protein
MNRKASIIIGLQAIIIVILFWFLVFVGKDEYEAANSEAEEGVETRTLIADNNSDNKGAATLILPTASQLQSGIVTAKLQTTSHQSTTASFGTVEAIDGLVELRTRYLAALAEGDVVRTAIAIAQQNVTRLTLLNQDDKNVSDRVLQEAEAALKNDQAKLIASTTLANGIRDSMRQQWGTTLANMATQTATNNALQQLLQYRTVLLKVTLPFDATPSKNTLLLVTAMGAQGQTIKAQLISDAPQSDSTIQGKTYFYQAPATNLRVGMRVTANLDTPSKAVTGVIVPHVAVVWYANQAWVYQKITAEKQGEDKFIRRLISTEIEIENMQPNGWFNATGFKASDELVVRGAQLLLSEELKYQIKNENED